MPNKTQVITALTVVVTMIVWNMIAPRVGLPGV